jgi:hypothetical protein
MSDEKIESIAEKTEDLRDKRIKELETELGKKADELGKQKEIVDQANIVANTIMYNEDLKSKFQEVYRKAYGGVSSEQPPKVEDKKDINGDVDSKIKPIAEKVEDNEMSQREEIIKDFEGRYNIGTLNKEDQKKVRTEIASFLGTFGHSAKSLPLSALSSGLEKAYMATQAERLKEEGKLEGFAQARENAHGTFSSMKGGEIPEEDKEKLTPAQIEWSKKLGADPEKAAKRYAEREKEGDTSK